MSEDLQRWVCFMFGVMTGIAFVQFCWLVAGGAA